MTPRGAIDTACRPAALAALAALLTTLAVALTALASTGPAAATAQPAAPLGRALGPALGAAGAVVVVGVPGLRWDDVTEHGTPTLWRLASAGATGSLSVRAAVPVTCPADGWVTLGAGNRARAARYTGRCPRRLSVEEPVPLAAGGVQVTALAAVRADNATLDFDARPGVLGESVHRSGGCTTAIGAGAALAAADESGRVDHYAPRLDEAPAGLLGRCALSIVSDPALADAGDAGDPARTDLTGHTDDARPDAGRRAALAAADARLGRVDAVRAPGSTLLVIGPAEIGADAPRLHVAIAVGPAGAGEPAYTAGRLTAASTRRPPFVQLIDVAPTVLGRLGIRPPPQIVGQPWRRVGGRPGTATSTVAGLVDLDRAARAQHRLTPPFFALLVGAQLLLYLLAYVALRRRPARADRRRVLAVTYVAALAFTAAPVATYLANLVPWWRWAHPLVPLLGAVAVAVAVVTAAALLGPWQRTLLGPAGAVAGVTAAVLTIDLLTGARLQLSSLAGYSPLVAGRFAGVGNVAYGVFVSGALLCAAALAEGRPRRTAVGVVVAIGAAAVVVDGSPTWGSDVGGVLALVPGTAVLAMLVAGVRVSIRRLALAGAVGVAVVTVFGLVDYARPPASRTHLGRFVGQLLHGGALTVLQRKAQANVHLLTHSVLTLLLPAATLFLTVVLLRPAASHAAGLQRAFERAPALRAGLLGVLATSLVGFLTNDSGVAVPAMAMTVAVPLALAVSVRALQLDATSPVSDPNLTGQPVIAPQR